MSQNFNPRIFNYNFLNMLFVQGSKDSLFSVIESENVLDYLSKVRASQDDEPMDTGKRGII